MTDETPDASPRAPHSDAYWMDHALSLARRAAIAGEVPVGAVLVKEGRAVGEGWNCPVSFDDPTAHAEIVAMREAARRTGNYRLVDTTLYVTLEPCIMCAGAMIHARVARLVYAAADPKTGAAGSVFDILADDRHNHRVAVEGGLMSEQAGEMLRAFFRERR